MNARWASPSRQSVAFRHAVGIIVAAIISLIGVPAQAQQSQNSALLERGRYLVEDASACGLCHTPRGADGRAVPGKALSGGRVMANDQYRAVVPNITVDPETGLVGGPTWRSGRPFGMEGGLMDRLSGRQCRWSFTEASRIGTLQR